MTQDQIDGLTKARLVCNESRAGTDDPLFETNDDYAAWVCKMAGLDKLPDYALNSYVEQHDDKDIPTLEVAVEEAVKAADETPA